MRKRGGWAISQPERENRIFFSLPRKGICWQRRAEPKRLPFFPPMPRRAGVSRKHQRWRRYRQPPERFAMAVWCMNNRVRTSWHWSILYPGMSGWKRPPPSPLPARREPLRLTKRGLAVGAAGGTGAPIVANADDSPPVTWVSQPISRWRN